MNCPDVIPSPSPSSAPESVNIIIKMIIKKITTPAMSAPIGPRAATTDDTALLKAWPILAAAFPATLVTLILLVAALLASPPFLPHSF